MVTDTDQSALKTAIQNSHPVVAYDVEQSADCYGTSRGLVVYKKDAHIYDRSKDYGAIRGLLWVERREGRRKEIER